MCQSNFCQNEKEKPTLHIHHRIYLRNTDPWDYENWAYQVLCDECHKDEQDGMEGAHAALAKHDDLMTFCYRLNQLSDRELQREISENLAILFSMDNKDVLWSLARLLHQLHQVSFDAFKFGLSRKEIGTADIPSTHPGFV